MDNTTNPKPDYEAIDAEAYAARDAAKAAAEAAGWTGWDVDEAGLIAARKVWRAHKVSSPDYREPIPDDDITASRDFDKYLDEAE